MRVLVPHTNVFTRLKPSQIHGVGVFAVVPIEQGTYIFPKDDAPVMWISKQEVGCISPEIQQLYDDFCIIERDKYGCPKSFNDLTPAWYLNHSEEPNAACDDDYNFYAKRNIAIGEEITVDYRTYSELP